VFVDAVNGAVAKQLVRIDSKYAGLFSDSTWKESTSDRLDMSTRFGTYSQFIVSCFVLFAAICYYRLMMK